MTRIFDVAEYLDTPEIAAEYLSAALETDDPVLIAKAIGDVAQGLCRALFAHWCPT